jgi:hypothetical protein
MDWTRGVPRRELEGAGPGGGPSAPVGYASPVIGCGDGAGGGLLAGAAVRLSGEGIRPVPALGWEPTANDSDPAHMPSDDAVAGGSGFTVSLVRTGSEDACVVTPPCSFAVAGEVYVPPGPYRSLTAKSESRPLSVGGLPDRAFLTPRRPTLVAPVRRPSRARPRERRRSVATRRTRSTDGAGPSSSSDSDSDPPAVAGRPRRVRQGAG